MEELLSFVTVLLPDLGRGLLTTLQISAVALLLGLVIGIPTAMLRAYGPRWLQWLATAYVELFRGTPLLVQLFVIYYGLPDLARALEGIGLPNQFLVLSRMAAAYLALGLNSGAYQAEYLRSAIQAINVGQIMAARALGMSKLQSVIHVVLPQALRLAIPAWSNEVAYMVKYTSVVFVISVPDLLARGQFLISKYYKPMETLLVVGMIYLMVVLGLTGIMNHIEKRVQIPGLHMEVERA